MNTRKETRTEYLIVRLSKDEKKQARRVARKARKAMSTMVREYFATLDTPRTVEAAA